MQSGRQIIYAQFTAFIGVRIKVNSEHRRTPSFELAPAFDRHPFWHKYQGISEVTMYRASKAVNCGLTVRSNNVG